MNDERLPDDLRDLLDAERDIEAPPRADRARMLGRLALVVPVLGGPGGASGPGDGGAAGDAGLGAGAGAGAGVAGAAGWKASATIAIVAATLGAGGGAATHAWLAGAPVAPSIAVSAGVAATAAPVDVAPVETAAPAPSSAAVPAAPPSAPRDDRAPGASTLRAERLLLERATAALMRGDHAAALATLRQHAASYPNGQLAEERNVLLQQATRAAAGATTGAPLPPAPGGGKGSPR
jgi:hypothetical protein